MNILILNSGSSSLKYQLINTQTDMILAKGNFERIGQQDSFLTHKLGSEKHKFELPAPNHEMALNIILGKLTSRTYGVISGIDKIDAIGHRIVHGGDKFVSSCLITEEVIKEIEDCIPLAPLHNPAAVAGIRACQDILVGKPNVAAANVIVFAAVSPKFSNGTENTADVPCPPVIGIEPVAIPIKGLIPKNLQIMIPIPFCSTTRILETMSNFIVFTPPFFRRDILAVKPILV